MEPLKTRGMKELGALRQRVRRQRALGRIGRIDYEVLDELLNTVEARIVSMTEHDKSEGEVGNGEF